MKGKYVGKNHPNWIDFTVDDINKMRELKESGHSYREIGKMFGVTDGTIKRRLSSCSQLETRSIK
jgi:DNA invertase Pin-like site-specific DNA recombinase